MSPITETDGQSTVATLLTGPGSASNDSSSVPENVGFRFVLDRTVQTLSSNGLPESGIFSGLVFVPDLPSPDPCNSITSPFIPSSVTRLKDISEYDYPLIALAPWVSPACTQSFLAASREVGTQALFFFQPSSNETGTPPPVSDKRWDLEDEGRWISQNEYPVFAISGPAGATLMNELAWFSNGEPQSHSSNKSHASTEPPRDPDQRLFAMVDATTKDNQKTVDNKTFTAILASLLIVLSFLALVWVLFLWRRRGPSRLRSARGNAGLHIHLGPPARRNTPREVLETMPMYVWSGPRTSHDATAVKEGGEVNVADLGTGDREVTSTMHDQQMDVEAAAGIREPEPALINPAVGQIEPAADLRRCRYGQTTCAICIEDFVADSSQVRELPCGHIFDPACIDPYLLGARNQCPVCKKSVLPPDFVYPPMEDTPRQEEGATRETE